MLSHHLALTLTLKMYTRHKTSIHSFILQKLAETIPVNFKMHEHYSHSEHPTLHFSIDYDYGNGTVILMS